MLQDVSNRGAWSKKCHLEQEMLQDVSGREPLGTRNASRCLWQSHLEQEMLQDVSGREPLGAMHSLALFAGVVRGGPMSLAVSLQGSREVVHDHFNNPRTFLCRAIMRWSMITSTIPATFLPILISSSISVAPFHGHRFAFLGYSDLDAHHPNCVGVGSQGQFRVGSGIAACGGGKGTRTAKQLQSGLGDLREQQLVASDRQPNLACDILSTSCGVYLCFLCA